MWLRLIRSRCARAAAAFVVSAVPLCAAAQTITVGAQETLTYPSALTTLPDEHLTFLPEAGSDQVRVFAASTLTGTPGGAVLLYTSGATHYRDFKIAPAAPTNVMAPPVAFDKCDGVHDSEFDENYVGPGSVFPDPTGPAGSMIMIYEAENHCPGGTNQFAYYATVGLARSADGGQTWPPPRNSATGGADRYPVLRYQTPEGTTPNQPATGDAIPSAFVDAKYVYVVYNEIHGPPYVAADGILRIARADLTPPAGDKRLHFRKWYDDGVNPAGFHEEGFGGLDSPMKMANVGCGFETGADLSWNAYLGAYLLVFACVNDTTHQGGWYFSTATSLAEQDWISPRPVTGFTGSYTDPCPPPSPGGSAFPGWYPSLFSPGKPSGRTDRTGFIYAMSGCDGSTARTFVRRAFTVAK